MPEKAAEAIEECLKSNTTIASLDLSGNPFKAAGAAIARGVVVSNSTLPDCADVPA